MAGLLIERGLLDRDTNKHTGTTPCAGRDQDDAAEAKDSTKHQKLGEKPGRHSPSQHAQGTKAAHTLVWDFYLPGQRDNTFLLFKQLYLWYFVIAALAHKYRLKADHLML